MSTPDHRPRSMFVLVLAVSALCWAVVFTSVPPSHQDFPLGDDWAFTQGAREFARGDGIHYYHWASMPLLGQWLWAWPLVRAFEGSHVALRLCTILLSWVGLWAFYDLLRQGGCSAPQSAFLSAALAVNPLFFLLQGTFMTDVPALALALLALALYGRAWRGGKAGMLLAAMVVAVLGVITRQNTICAPVAIGVLLARDALRRRRPAWWLAIGLPVAVGLAVNAWFIARPDVLPIRPAVPGPVTAVLLVFMIVHFVGLSVLPAWVRDPLPGLWKSAFREGGSSTTAALVQVLLLGIAGAAILGGVLYWSANQAFYTAIMPEYDTARWFPYALPMIGPEGPFAGMYVVGGGPVLLDGNTRMVLTLLGCLGGAALVLRLLTWVGERWAPGPLLMFTLLELGLILVAPKVYDRYFLFLIPGALYLVGAHPSRPALRWAPGLAMLVLSAGVSVAMMHDWLSWNAARWQLGWRALNQHHIQARDIEGGLEWDGWFAPTTQDASASENPPSGGPIRLNTTYDFRFWHITGRYALAFSGVPNVQVLDREPYELWLVPGRHEFQLIQYVTSAPQ